MTKKTSSVIIFHGKFVPLHRHFIIKFIIMARQIAETPILFGEDAERFLHDMNHVQPASQQEREEASHSFEWMKSIATFSL